MTDKRQNHFRDDIRRTFITYALVPILLISIVFFILMITYWNTSVFKRNNSSRESVCLSLSTLVDNYVKEAEDIAALCDIDQLHKNKVTRQALSTVLYKFTNQMADSAEVYVLDADFEPMVATLNTKPDFVSAETNANWGIIARMRNSPKDSVYDFVTGSGEPGRPMDLAIGKAITLGEKVTGYVVFLIPGHYFLKYTDDFSANIIVADRYNYARITNTSTYTTPFGNLKSEIGNAHHYFNINGEWYYFTQSPILQEKLIVYAITPIKATLISFIIAGGILILMLIIVGFGIVFGAQRVAKSKTQIIDQLVEAFEAVEAGNLDTHLAITTGDEFEIIGDTYNIMLSSLKELIRKNNEEARQTVLSEIKQLESQFNPHFLFNTLENIKFMIKLNPDSATKMIVCLSTLLRYSISNSITGVTLAEDMEFTENYLSIQKYRFNSRFNYTLDLADEIRDCIVPKLIIQPIIENSTKYSFEGKDNLTVSIKAEMYSGNLLITIQDDGDGINLEKLNELRTLMESTVNESNHIGLYNINRRIKLMYGENYGLTLDSRLNVGTCVKMLLPVHRKENDTNA